jgi:hypothetical protein
MRRFLLLSAPVLLTAGLSVGCSKSISQTAAAASAVAAGPHTTIFPGIAGARRSGFAALADRGDLVAYPAPGVVRRETASTWYRADVSEAHAMRSIVTGEMIVTTPDGQPIRLSYERYVEHPNGNWTWIGRDANGEDAVLTFGERAVFGSIPQGDRGELRLATIGGHSWMVQADPGKQHHPDSKQPDYLVPPELAASLAMADATSASATTNAQAAATAAATTVDVALGYTLGFAMELGGDSQAVTRLQNLIDITNQAYANSQINAQVRLVKTVAVNYPDATDNDDTLTKLSGYKSGTGKVTPDAAFTALRSARDQYGADLVSLVRRFRTPENKGCGLAWLIGGGQSSIDNSDAYFGYSVVSDDLDSGDVDEGDHKTYVCRKESLAHELGHNMGQQHNVEDSGGDPGAHAYSYGYREASSTGFYTVMAYRLTDSSQRSVRYFANPNVTEALTGRPTGVANASDNARSMLQTMPLIAQFRATVPTDEAFNLVFCDAGRFDFNGDTVSDLLWRNRSDGSNSIWNSAMSGQKRAISAVPSQLWQVAAVGDFTGDGASDVIWRHSTGGWNVIWPSGNSQLAQDLTAVPTQVWKIVGVGDFNGDGRSDLLWRHMQDGWNLVWLGGNSATTLELSPVPSQIWRVAAVADFNGDRKADILWRHARDGWNTIWLGGQSATTMAVSPMSRDWNLAATGDFTGDTRADLIWRNTVNGRDVLWSSAQSIGAVELTAVPSSTWQIAAVGDFTADGSLDLVWRHNVDGWNVLWPSANSQLARDITPIPSQSWQTAGMCRQDAFVLPY